MSGRSGGAINNGDRTDDNQPTFQGKTEANTTVIIYDNGQEIGRVPTDVAGNWSFTPSTELIDGEHSFSQEVVDAAGNKGELAPAIHFIVDTVIPGKPSIETVFDDQGSVTGNLSQGQITDDSKPTLSGKAESGSTVVIYDQGIKLGAALTDASGVWTFEPILPLGSGSHKLSVEAVDAAGNTSPRSDTFEFEIQVGAPAVPQITVVKDDVGSIQGSLQKNAITDDVRPTIEGTAEVGNTVSVYSNDKLLGTVVADGQGNWSFTPSVDLGEGLNKITATATNLAGNVSPKTGEFPIMVDTMAPGKPSASDAELLDDVGTITGLIASGDTTDDNRPTFQGKAESNATVVIYDSGQEIGRVPTDAQGNWSFTSTTPLVDGPHSLSQSVIDAAGNKGEQSAPVDFTVDTSAVLVSLDGVQDDAGSLKGAISKGGVTDDTTPTVQGKATSNSTVSVYDKGVLLGSTTADASGNWSFTPSTALSEGAHELTATVTTAANGESAPTAKFDLTIDTIAPSQSIIDAVSDDVGSIQGPVTNGGSTDDTTPTLSGKAEPGSTVHISDNGGLLGSVLVDGSGNWNFTPTTPLNGGEHSFTVASEDKAGNVSEPSNPFVVNIDTAAPGKPSIETVFDDQGSVTGNLSQGQIADDSKPTLSGKAESGSTAVIYDKGVEIGRVPVDASGNWSFTPSTALAGGAHSVTVAAVDKAGNISVVFDAFAFTVDTVPPTQIATVTSMSKDSGYDSGDWLTNDGAAGRLMQGTLSGALATHETLQVSTDGGLTWMSALVDGITWVAQGNKDHSNNWTIQTRVVDTSGYSGSVTSQGVVLDKLAPTAVSAVTVNGKQATIAFDNKDVIAGDRLVIVDGTQQYEYVLTSANVSAGKVVVDSPLLVSSDALFGVITYNVYQHSGLAAELLVQSGVQVALV